MYTTKIIKAEQSPTAADIAEITVEYYKDGVLVDTQIHRTGEVWTLSSIAQNQVNEYIRKDALAEFLANAPINEEAIKIVTPTQEQIDARAYELKKEELVVAKKDLDLGLIDQAAYEKKKAEVIAIQPAEVISVITP